MTSPRERTKKSSGEVEVQGGSASGEVQAVVEEVEEPSIRAFTSPRTRIQVKPDLDDIYIDTHDFREEMEEMRKELEEMPNRMDAHAVLGWSLVKLERYREALEASQEAFRISRYDPRIIETAGEALFYIGRPVEALRYE